jgi:hypothetical protein
MPYVNFTKASLTYNMITGFVGDIMVVNCEITIVEYGLKSESLQSLRETALDWNVNEILLFRMCNK